MGFTIPKDGDVLSETEMTAMFEFLKDSAQHGYPSHSEIDRAIPNIGDRTSDGTIYAGISRETGRAMFTTLEAGPIFASAQDAERYASTLCDAKGRKGFQIPAGGELSVLWNNGLVKSEAPMARLANGGAPAITAPVRCIRYGQLEL